MRRAQEEEEEEEEEKKKSKKKKKKEIEGKERKTVIMHSIGRELTVMSNLFLE